MALMAPRAMILYPNRADAPKGSAPGAEITGPAWATPLANLQDFRPSRRARSVDTTPANTQFDVRLTRQNEIKALVLCRHNLSVTASWRVRAWYDDQSADASTYDSTQDVYPSLGFTEDLAWEDDNWWDGKPLDEEIEGFAQNAILILPAFVSAPNWRVEIFDPTNPEGYVEVTHLFMAGGWQPSHNYSYGGALGFEDPTTVEASLSGVEYFDVREPYRVQTVAFEYLPEDEALLKGLEICRRAGIHGRLFWIADPENPRTLTQTSFMGRLRQLSPWEQVSFGRANIAYEIKEVP